MTTNWSHLSWQYHPPFWLSERMVWIVSQLNWSWPATTPSPSYWPPPPLGSYSLFVNSVVWTSSPWHLSRTRASVQFGIKSNCLFHLLWMSCIHFHLLKTELHSAESKLVFSWDSRLWRWWPSLCRVNWPRCGWQLCTHWSLNCTLRILPSWPQCLGSPRDSAPLTYSPGRPAAPSRPCHRSPALLRVVAHASQAHMVRSNLQ